MSDQTNTDRTPRPSPQPDEPAARRPYNAPRLVEYGDIATLTQTGGLTRTDAGGGKKQRIG